MPKPNCRSIADAMAGNGASHVLLAPRELRDDVIASCAAAFRDACIEYGIMVEHGDLAYYVRVVTAKVAEMSGAASVQSEEFN
jgi:ABC-type tungstate transport system substrate-binding protein